MHEFDGKQVNQLQYFASQDLLAGAPTPEKSAKMPDAHDSTTGTITERARAWLHVNCAHCHSPYGTARTSGLDLRVSQSDATKFRRVEIAGGGRSRIGWP